MTSSLKRKESAWVQSWATHWLWLPWSPLKPLGGRPAPKRRLITLLFCGLNSSGAIPPQPCHKDNIEDIRNNWKGARRKIANLCLLFSNLRKGRLHYIRPVGWSVGWSVSWCHHWFSFSSLTIRTGKAKISIQIRDLHCLLAKSWSSLCSISVNN